MSLPLLQNFKIIETPNNNIIMLDQDSATPTDINMYVGFLLGRISAQDMANPFQYSISDFSLTHYGQMGTTVVIPDFYHDHAECHLILSHHQIATAFSKEQNCYVSSKICINPDSQSIEINDEYSICHASSQYLNESGLLALINCLEQDNQDKLEELFKVFNKKEIA